MDRRRSDLFRARYDLFVTSAHSTPYVSLEEFLEMEPAEGTWLEWCGGLVYAMSGGSPTHSKLSALVIGALLSRVGSDCTVFDSKVDIWVERAEFYGQADVSVVCGPLHVHKVTRKDKTLGEAITNPQVVVEVLSPSTEARDRGESFAAYKQTPRSRSTSSSPRTSDGSRCDGAAPAGGARISRRRGRRFASTDTTSPSTRSTAPRSEPVTPW
ncbi:hypothetical protein BH11MYX4_BH11MYX4_55720 [soil metagenome]